MGLGRCAKRNSQGLRGKPEVGTRTTFAEPAAVGRGHSESHLGRRKSYVSPLRSRPPLTTTTSMTRIRSPCMTMTSCRRSVCTSPWLKLLSGPKWGHVRLFPGPAAVGSDRSQSHHGRRKSCVSPLSAPEAYSKPSIERCHIAAAMPVAHTPSVSAAANRYRVREAVWLSNGSSASIFWPIFLK